MDTQVQLALIAAGSAVIASVVGLINTGISLWRESRDRKWKREDAEWKAASEARGVQSLQQTSALNEKADANMVVSTAAADASQTAAAAGVKAVAAATGEPEHKVLADVKADVNRRLGAVFGPYVGDADAEAEEGPGRGNSARLPR